MWRICCIFRWDMECTPAHPPRQEAQKRWSLGRKLHNASMTNRNPSWLAEFKKQLIYLRDTSYLQTVTKGGFYFEFTRKFAWRILPWMKISRKSVFFFEIHQISSPLGIPDSNRLEKTCCIRAPDLGRQGPAESILGSLLHGCWCLMLLFCPQVCPDFLTLKERGSQTKPMVTWGS